MVPSKLLLLHYICLLMFMHELMIFTFNRYNVIELNKYSITAKLAVGPYKDGPNAEIDIPRIKFLPDDQKCPVEFQRIQYPIRIDFGITSNRSQGKTFIFIGIDLTTDFFSHGQLYVSISRVGSPKSIRIFKPKTSPSYGYMRNVVYPEILSAERIEVQPRTHETTEDEPIVKQIRMPYHQQKTELAPERLREAGFKEREETPGDGNCFIHALKEQMR